MSITYIPREKSGIEQFQEGFSPYLQMAMEYMLKKKMAEETYKTNMQRNMQMQPELFAPTPQMVSAPQGFENRPGAVNGQLPVSPNPKLPPSYQFLQNKAQPGQEFNATTGELSFKKPQPQVPMFGYLPGMGTTPPTLPLSPSEAKSQFLSQNPQYNEKDIVVSSKPVPGGKGTMYYEAGVSPEAIRGKVKAGDIQSEVQGIDNMVNSIYDAADRLIPAFASPKQAEKIGLQRSIGSASILGMRPQRMLGLSNENVIAYNDIMKAEATPIIRAMGEKGMLTNQDIERALGLFAKNSDSIQLRETRKEELKKFLKSKVKAYYKGNDELNQATEQDTEYQKYLQAIGGGQ